jgi:capsular polysaccharide biosynthesis protein
MTTLKMFKFFAKAVLMPFLLLEKALTLLASLSTKSASAINLFITAIKQIPRKLKKNSAFQLVPINQLLGYTKIAETQGGVEDVILPRIVGLSNGGRISVNMPGDYLCSLNNVSFVPFSDFIREKNGQVANEKLLRKEYDVSIPCDRDIVEITGKIIKLSNVKDVVNLKIAFNLMGANSGHWAHFLAQYYPKLNFLNNLPKSEDIDLVIPNETDPHIKFLIENELKNYPRISVLEVDVGTEITCDKLYHVSLGTFVADDGYIPTPFSILISNSSLSYWFKKSMELVPKDSNQYRKIFIGRKGYRNLKNYNEVLDYFVAQGFEEISPHLLSIEQKIQIFSEAKYIVGPASSGFINCIYAQTGTKLLSFINSYRYLDAYLSGFCNKKEQEFWFLTGKDDNVKDMNSSFEISLTELKLFLEEVNFFDNKNEVREND